MTVCWCLRPLSRGTTTTRTEWVRPCPIRTTAVVATVCMETTLRTTTPVPTWAPTLLPVPILVCYGMDQSWTRSPYNVIDRPSEVLVWKLSKDECFPSRARNIFYSFLMTCCCPWFVYKNDILYIADMMQNKSAKCDVLLRLVESFNKHAINAKITWTFQETRTDGMCYGLL